MEESDNTFNTFNTLSALSTGYEHLGWVNKTFWALYVSENEDSPLYSILDQWTISFTAPLHTLNKFARTCKTFFSIVQWRLTKSRVIAAKWIGVAVKKYPRWSLRRIQPIKYTSRTSKTIPIDDALAVNQIGICPLDTLHTVFTPEELSNTVYALCNIHLRARAPVECIAMLFVGTTPVCSATIDPSKYILTVEENTKDNTKGRYIVNLNLPIQYNPILLGGTLANTSISLCIARDYISYMDNGEVDTILQFDFDFALSNFTHVISSFRTISASVCDPTKYEFSCNGDVDKYVKTNLLTIEKK